MQLIPIFKPDEEGKYGIHRIYAEDDTITSDLFPGLGIKLTNIFLIPPDFSENK